VAAARFVAVVHALVPVVAGSVRMRYRRFLGWSALGAAAWSVTFVGIGALAGRPGDSTASGSGWPASSSLAWWRWPPGRCGPLGAGRDVFPRPARPGRISA